MSIKIHIPLLIAILLLSPSLYSQIVNNLSPDKSNMYVHAVDSLAKIIDQIDSFNYITLFGDKSITQYFPDIINGIRLVKKDKQSKKPPKIKPGEVRFKLQNIRIIRDEFKISVSTWKRNEPLGDGLYVFRYKFIPTSMTYELKEIKTGFGL